MKLDNQYTYDKLTDVYRSGTKHEEHQPSHLVIADYDICNNRCTQEYGNPCQHFCPASVYSMVDDPERPGKLKLELTPSNCVHCKTCDIAGVPLSGNSLGDAPGGRGSQLYKPVIRVLSVRTNCNSQSSCLLYSLIYRTGQFG